MVNEKFQTLLTKREKAIAELYVSGKSSTDIANSLFISSTTVRTHLG